MPSIEDINSKSKFKKKNYRAWNITGAEKSEESALPLVNKTLIDNPCEQVIELETSDIKNWDYHDRPEYELGDIDALALDLKTIGQQQPCIVRPLPNGKYELIIGERRWRAAQKAGISLKVIVRPMSDTEAALSQSAENDNRLDLSDYAKGMHFDKLIKLEVITQKDLTDRLGKSKQYVSSLLTFAKIPEEIVAAIGKSNMKNITASTAEKIKQLSEKGPEYIKAIIKLADRLASGKIGKNSLIVLINSILHEDLSKKDLFKKEEERKILSKDGRHIFTWRTDNNRLPSIHFPKSIINLLESEDLNIKDLTDKFASILEDELLNLTKSA